MSEARAFARLSPTTELPFERAIRGEGVRTVVQPIVDLHRGCAAGYEALTRFDLVPGVGPDVWFAAATERGLTAELEATTLATAIRRWAEVPTNCFLTVNVEPASLASPAVAAVLDAAGDLRGLVLELTEHRPVDFIELAPLMRRYRAAGAKIAVDDAGSGYSGLQQILELRPDFLKLDRSLVTGIDTDLAKAALVEMIGVFADRIDAWVIAEGIETESELDAVADLGIPLAQGWHLARPADEWPRPQLGMRTARPGDAPLQALMHRPDVVSRAEEEMAEELLVSGRAPYVVLVDEHQRPTAVVDIDDLLACSTRAALRANVGDPLAAVARRAAIRGGRDDVLVTDDDGRLLGAVSLQRLLLGLADEVDAAEV